MPRAVSLHKKQSAEQNNNTDENSDDTNPHLSVHNVSPFFWRLCEHAAGLNNHGRVSSSSFTQMFRQQSMCHDWSNEMIAAKLPYQRFRCLKICKRFRYNWRKKRE